MCSMVSAETSHGFGVRINSQSGPPLGLAPQNSIHLQLIRTRSRECQQSQVSLNHGIALFQQPSPNLWAPAIQEQHIRMVKW